MDMGQTKSRRVARRSPFVHPPHTRSPAGFVYVCVHRSFRRARYESACSSWKVSVRGPRSTAGMTPPKRGNPSRKPFPDCE